MRSAVSQAGNAANQAKDTAAQYGASGQAIGSTLTPFLTNELEHPQGYSQQDLGAQEASALAGAGGANAGIAGMANKEAAVTRNAGGFQAALDDAARSRDKAAAGASEGIAANNANLKQEQMQNAAQGLQRMYGLDTSAQLESQGQQANDINAEVNAGKSGWLQNTLDIINTLNGGAQSAAGMKKAGMF